MNRSIRKLVGVGAAALALGGFFAVIVAPQVTGASSGSHRTAAGGGVANVITKLRTEQTAAIDRNAVIAVHPAVTPSSSCTTAKANLASAMASRQGRGHDRTRRRARRIPTRTEDKAELAAQQTAW